MPSAAEICMAEPETACFHNISRKVALYRSMELTPDAHGQAALMLFKGFLPLLVEKGIIDKDETADLREGIIDIKQEIVGVRESLVVSVASITLLRAMARSFSVSAGRERSAAL